MASAPPVDAAGEKSVLPLVARPRGGPAAWVLVLAAIGVGLVLFTALDARRRALSAPVAPPRTGEAPALAPSLFVPPIAQPTPVAEQAVQPPPPAQTPPVIVRLVESAYQPPAETVDAPTTTTPTPASNPSEAALVIDNTTGNAGRRPTPDGERPAATASIAGARTSAGVLANRSATVPQGTLIPAVLETALDSTSPGIARAVVTGNVRGFDGSRVLIPIGSRLIGEVGADTRSGQNRMLVNWIRLIRPDGVTIAIGSPATDPLGRGGIRASVNSHFFERFTGAILQSALDVGVNLASRSADNSLIVTPGTMSAVAPPQNGNDIQPTLKVKGAVSISILVSRDLDFTGVASR